MEIKVERWDEGRLLVNSEFAELLRHNGILSGEALWKISSEPVKKVAKDRGTSRSYLEPVSGTEFVETYVKRYEPQNFSFLISNMLSFKPPPLDALGEWQAMLDFHRLGLSTLVPIAAASCGSGTCNLTLGVRDYVRASALFKSFGPGDRVRKLALIEKLAQLVARMHSEGFAHRDCYLLHFFVEPALEDKLRVIDLQRLVREKPLGRRWRVKDLAQLLFSARDISSRADAVRFWRTYTDICGKSFSKDSTLISEIQAKADSIYARALRKGAS